MCRGLSPASKAIALAVIVGGSYYAKKALRPQRSRRDADDTSAGAGAGAGRSQSGRKKEAPFGQRLAKILKILFSGRDKPIIYGNLAGLTLCLVLRTLLSIQVFVPRARQ